MAGLLIFIAVAFVGVGLNRAWAYAKGRRRFATVLLHDPSPDVHRALRVVDEINRLPKWKRAVIVPLQFAVDVPTWPVFEFMVPRDRRRRANPPELQFRDTRWLGSAEEFTAQYVSRDMRRRSLMTLVLAVLVLAAAIATASGRDRIQIVYLSWVAVLGLMARQTLDLMSGNVLVNVARRSGSPLLRAYQDFALSAVFDLATLVVCSVLVLRWMPSAPLRLEWFGSQVVAVLKGVHVSSIWQSARPSQVLIALASMTFYASLINPAKVALRRKRTGEEFMAAAEHALKTGNGTGAQRLYELGSSRDPSPRSQQRTRGLLALAQGSVEGAWDAGRAMVRLYRPEANVSALNQNEDGLCVLQGWCHELSVSPKPSVLELARDAGVRDSFVVFLLNGWVDDLLVESATRAGSLAKVLDPIMWPMAFSQALELDGDVVRAAELLPPADQVDGIDLLWRNQMERRQANALDELRGVSVDWAQRFRTYSEQLLADVARSDIATWPEWHRSDFGRQLTLPLLVTDSNLDPETVEGLTAIRDALLGARVSYMETVVFRQFALSRHRPRAGSQKRPPQPRQGNS